jgi:peptide/nickel transport system substrate-binding protein
MNIVRTIAASLLAGLLVQPALGQSDDILRVSTPFDEAAGLNPIGSQGFFYVYGVSELLMQFREDGQFHPWLLESLENSGELTWEGTLREGITFQNGKPVDAAAVVAVMQHQLANSPAARGAFPEGTQFAANGERGIVVTTPRPFPALPGLLSDRNVYSIFDLAAAEAVNGDWASLGGDGIYTGAFAVEAIDSEHLTLVRNPDYWQGTPHMAGVDVRFVRDTNAAALAVQNGEIDIALFMPVAVRQVVEASGRAHFNFRPSEGLVDQAYHLFFNTQVAPFDDPVVRQAVSMGIDYRELAEDVFGGVHGVGTGLYGSLYDYALENQETDPAAAAALLDGSGWIAGSDGIRQKDGNRLTLEVVYNPSVADLVTIGTAIQAQLAELGVELVITQVDDTATALASRPWNASMFRNSLAGIPELFLRRFMTAEGDRNYGQYDNTEFAELVRQLEVTLEETERAAILQRIQQIAVDEDPYVLVLAFSQAPVVVSPAFHDTLPGFYFQHINWQTQAAN